MVGAPEPAGQHPQQLLGDLGTVGDPGAQRVAVHRHRAELVELRGRTTSTRVARPAALTGARAVEMSA